LGGLVMAVLGRAPEAGDEVTLGNLILHVESMDGRRIEYVTVRLAKPDDDKTDGGAS